MAFSQTLPLFFNIVNALQNDVGPTSPPRFSTAQIQQVVDAVNSIGSVPNSAPNSTPSARRASRGLHTTG